MMVNSPKSYFFLGIGGIGMSALARYVLAQGHKVLGYDKVPSVITESLINSGAVITFDSVLTFFHFFMFHQVIRLVNCIII